MGPGPGSQARNDAALARMAHRDRSSLVSETRDLWARSQATAPTQHLVRVCQYICLAGCRGDLGGARSRDSALPPGRAGCGQRARLSLSATGGRSGERLSGGDSRDAIVLMSRRWHLNHLRGEKSMKVLIAGATGALGVPLVRALKASGHEVKRIN